MYNFIRSLSAQAIITNTLVASLVVTLSACGGGSGNETEQTGTETPGAEPTVGAATVENGTFNDAENLQVAGNQIAADLPYPLYPNGTAYRTGNENGLKIVLFQTEDSFAEVDAYYEDTSNMSRLSAMSDYVRYSVGGEDIDNDPWATNQPGIVIHRFNDESEREAVGAGDGALTNIIMSY